MKKIVKNIFWSIKFGEEIDGQKKSWVKKNFGQKIFRSKKYLGQKKFVRPKTIVW